MLCPIFQTLTPEYTLLCLKGYLEIICSLIWGSFEALHVQYPRGLLNNILYGEALPRGPTPHSFTIFVRKGTPSL